ncbi:MAG: ATP-binding protein [Saprospiraceae bacterium]|nr:ATP-binding protein [Saprospiraceae bacterium]
MSTGKEPDRAELLAANAGALAKEMAWFESVLTARLAPFVSSNAKAIDQPPEPKKPQKNLLGRLFSRSGQADTDTGTGTKFLVEIPKSKNQDKPVVEPDWADDNSFYANFVREYDLLPEDRLVVMLALAPHIQPELLNRLFYKDPKSGLGDPRFGGILGNHHGGFLPTVETALFLLSGNDLGQRFQDEHIFHPDSVLLKQKILVLVQPASAEPFESSPIRLSEDVLTRITQGTVRAPRFNMDFPAKLLTTPLKWDDLILNQESMSQVKFINHWLNNRKSYKNEFDDLHTLKPGFKALFCGPPGTGKTLTAALLGQQNKLDVYRVDLSMVVSKYIGETEKNLEKVFTRAEGKDWILFFDEADALFGKRTNISDAHDKYANQEISYLLQRLEDYPGLVILASNMQHNIDEAFARRLHAIVQFPRPSKQERCKLWHNALVLAGLKETCGHFASELAERYELTGAGIVNAVYYAALLGISDTTPAEDAEGESSRQQAQTKLWHLYQGIRKEYLKEGKTF